MQTQVLGIETPAQLAAAVEQAAARLAAGELVAVPTETVYGLAANALDENAVRRIYAVKGRPARNPIIVHVASLKMAQACAAIWPEAAGALAVAFWPGPITFVLRKSAAIPSVVTAGGETVGIRWPLHPFMQQLIQRCGFPIAAPSANLSNELSPTTGEHVGRTLSGKIPLIVDAGPSSVGIESSVIDLTVEPPALLRPGMVSAEQISRVLGKRILSAPGGPALKSPGLLPKHYAPRARLVVADWKNGEGLKRRAERLGIPLEKVHVLAHEQIPQANLFGRVALIPHDPEAYARALYAELHRCDELGAELIVVEDVPGGEEWNGIRDRLKRASTADLRL